MLTSEPERGYVTVLAIVSVMLIIIAAGALNMLSSTELRTAVNFRDGVAAQYLAEAGARRAIVELTNNPVWDPGLNGWEETLGDGRTKGKYKVYVTAVSETSRRVRSIGEVNLARRQVVVDIKLTGSRPQLTIEAWNNH